jgi:hypothetical protein
MRTDWVDHWDAHSFGYACVHLACSQTVVGFAAAKHRASWRVSVLTGIPSRQGTGCNHVPVGRSARLVRECQRHVTRRSTGLDISSIEPNADPGWLLWSPPAMRCSRSTRCRWPVTWNDTPRRGEVGHCGSSPAGRDRAAGPRSSSAVDGGLPAGSAVKLVARTHQSLIWDRTRHVLRLRSTLRDFYPATLQAFLAAATSRVVR